MWLFIGIFVLGFVAGLMLVGEEDRIDGTE